LRAGGFGRRVGGSQPSSTGRDHELMVNRCGGQELRDQVVHVGEDPDRTDFESGLLEQPPDCGATLVMQLACRSSIADGQDHRPHLGGLTRRHSPDLPLLLASSWTDSRKTPLPTPLTMSISVRPATAAAVSASISTPVLPVTRTVASTRTPASPTSNSTATEVMGSG